MSVRTCEVSYKHHQVSVTAARWAICVQDSTRFSVAAMASEAAELRGRTSTVHLPQQDRRNVDSGCRASELQILSAAGPATNFPKKSAGRRDRLFCFQAKLSVS